jgi:hypothetical protein
MTVRQLNGAVICFALAGALTLAGCSKTNPGGSADTSKASGASGASSASSASSASGKTDGGGEHAGHDHDAGSHKKDGGGHEKSKDGDAGHEGHDHAPAEHDAHAGHDHGPGAHGKAAATAGTQTAELGCAGCIFGMKDVQGCIAAVKIDGKAMLFAGTDLDAHATGLCKKAKAAEVVGKVEGGKFVATSYKFK